MYRVLIADDEPSVVSSLEKSIDWTELGLEMAGAVNNGNAVLEFLEREPIDILILDIRMPGLNGLEVCEQLHNIREDLQIIIISGYAEFSYAERAIRYGVLGYCLKPLEYDKVIHLLLKAEKNCEKKKRRSQEVDLIEAIERNDIESIRKKMLLSGLGESGVYIVVSTGERKLSFEFPYLLIEIGRDEYGYLCSKALSKDTLEKMRKERKILGIGYTEERIIPESIPEVLNICVTGAFQYFVDARQRVCGSIDAGKAVVHLETMRDLITKNKWDDAKKLIMKLGKEEYKTFTVRSALKLCNMIHNGKLFSGAENDYYVYSIRELISDYDNIQNMFEQLYRDIVDVEEQQKKTLEYTNNAFMELMEYIEENYKTDISLAKVAQHCHMNTNYISQLFKKETGTTFVHYITQLRMEEAIRLLRTTRKSTAEISSLVGFNDYFYFLKTFKKYTGKTLGQYRAEI